MGTAIPAIFALCLLSTVSAAPLSMVFSAVVRNVHSEPMTCTIRWGTFSNVVVPNEAITIPSNQKTVVHEKIVDMGTWTAAAFMEAIECGDAKLIAPFPKVTNTQRCWQFQVEAFKITSVGSGSCA